MSKTDTHTHTDDGYCTSLSHFLDVARSRSDARPDFRFRISISAERSEPTASPVLGGDPGRWRSGTTAPPLNTGR
eukprot:813133-Prorocentrum_minimum.AAC.1